jgi:alpha-N-arabinofuranosidase
MNQLIIHTNQPGAKISRHFYGHFSEHPETGIYEWFLVGEDSPIPATTSFRILDFIEKLK